MVNERTGSGLAEGDMERRGQIYDVGRIMEGSISKKIKNLIKENIKIKE